MTTSYKTPTMQGGMGQKVIGSPCEVTLASVAAGSATNDTFYCYIPITVYRKLGLQLEWTAGAAGGTITMTVEATCQPVSSMAGDPATATYHDVTNALFGVASYTDDCITTDNAEKICCFSYVRVKVVVTNKDASTAWYLYGRLNT